MSDPISSIKSIIDKTKCCFLTTTDGDGTLHSRPMTPLEITDEWVVTFITDRATSSATEGAGKPVNLGFSHGMDYVSISGTAEVVEDVERKKALWNPMVEAFAPGGPENPESVLLSVQCETARVWDLDSKPVALVKMLKAALTDEQAEPGDVTTVELS